MSTKKGRYGSPAKRRKLSGDLQRLVQPNGLTDPRQLGGTMVDAADDPHSRGTVFLDLTDAVLLGHVDVCTVDTVRAGELGGQVAFMTLSGRVNKTRDQVQVGFVLDPDGAAAIITELLALADRFGPELLDDTTRRLTELHRGKNVDLHWLRAAIDNVLEAEGAA